MAAFPTLDDASFAGKRVLVREDLNVPMDGDRVTDATRLARIVPNIEELAKKRGKVILLSHLGRPKAKPDLKYTLKPVAAALSEELGKPVAFAADCVGPVAEAAVAAMKEGDILLLENTRFHPGEEKNDPAFVAALARLGDIYVNDAFSTAHRAHASTEGLAHLLPAYAGRTMQSELDMLASMLATPQHPVAAIIGGAKVSTKLELLGNLLQTVDILMIGGGMANTFLAAAGKPIGKSLQEADLAATSQKIMADAAAAKCRIVLPVDAAVATKLEPGVAARTVAIADVRPDDMILDIGPKSVEAIETLLRTTKTLLWNGPFGVFEVPPFDKGTTQVAKLAAQLTQAGGLKTIAGGGDTIAALNHAGVIDDFTYVSTAGGAFLEWLEGKLLPGVEALRNADYVL